MKNKSPPLSEKKVKPNEIMASVKPLFLLPRGGDEAATSARGTLDFGGGFPPSGEPLDVSL